VPKTAVYENRYSRNSMNEVWFAKHITRVQLDLANNFWLEVVKKVLL